MSVVTTLGQFVYTLPKIADAGDPPCTDNTWTATTTSNAPSARAVHTAVWTGSEMIVWGGGTFPRHTLTPAGDTIQHEQLDSHQHHQRAHLPESFTRQCGPAVK